MNKSIYYDSSQLLSRQSTVNFVMGERGNGKSFDAKKRMINNFIKKGEQSVLIRRRRTDIDEIKELFFNDIMEFYPNHVFKVEGTTCYIDGEPAIHLIALSTSLKKKSIPYPKVTLIVFDEYIEPSFKFPNYLKNDMFYLLELINTIVRDRNNWRMLIIGNSISYVNPFFDYYNIKITDNEKRFHSYNFDTLTNNYLITVELTQTFDFREKYSHSKLARLIQNTEYGNYAMNANVYEDNNDFIRETRKGNYIYICTLLSDNRELAVWYDEYADFYIDEKIQENAKFKYYMKDSDLKESFISAKNNNKNWRLKDLKRCYHEGTIYYSSQSVKKHFIVNCVRYF